MAYGKHGKSDIKVALGGLGIGLIWVFIVGVFSYWLAVRGNEEPEAVGLLQAPVSMSIQA